MSSSFSQEGKWSGKYYDESIILVSCKLGLTYTLINMSDFINKQSINRPIVRLHAINTLSFCYIEFQVDLLKQNCICNVTVNIVHHAPDDSKCMCANYSHFLGQVLFCVLTQGEGHDHDNDS